MKWLPSCLLLTCLAPAWLHARSEDAGKSAPLPPPGKAAVPSREVPVADKLGSPRETARTLYFSVIAYDYRPNLIQDAIACLELDPARSRQPAEAALLAIQLEEVLRGLTLPLHAIPDSTEGDRVLLYDAGGCRITMSRNAAGQWRFDRETLERLPVMHRQTVAHQKSAAETAGLRQPYTDPRSTMRRFLSDFLGNDFYAASQALDLGNLSTDQRTETGTVLAQQLAYVIQRRGWIFQQEIPSNPAGAPYTWYADQTGRILLERVPGPDGKDAWLFSRKTLRNLAKMYEQVKNKEPDVRYVWLGKLVPALSPDGRSSVQKRPDTVPAHLGSPRAMLKGFFRTMDASRVRDSKLVDALEYLDLQDIAPGNRKEAGAKLADNLEAVLRKLAIDLSSIPDDWNAPPQSLGKDQSAQIEIVRQRDGCWRFSQATIAQVPALYAHLASKDQADREAGGRLESARDCIAMFLEANNRLDADHAAQCLDLSDIHAGARSDLGPVLAFKLKWIIDRLVGRVYVQEVPDEPEGPRYNMHRSERGRIVVARLSEGPRKGEWLFTADTVERIERMFRQTLQRPPDESVQGMKGIVLQPSFWGTPGLWLRVRLPQWAQVRAWKLEVYQWLGLVVAVLVAGLTAKLLLSQLYHLVAWLLHRTGSALSNSFVAQKLRPLTWVLACWLLFELLAYLDLPVAVINTVLPLKKFMMAGLIGWLGFQLIDLVTGIYINSELLGQHRSLSDMIVPVMIRLLQTVVVLMVLIYVIYQVGEGDSLGRFLTGLGVAGLAVSLAAQDILKSFFGTLLLIGERSFKLGDRIVVDGKEGAVEQVGFRSTRLRTADGALVTVPNSMIASAPINNLGARSYRRFQTTVSLGLDTPIDRILALRDHLREWLLTQPQIDGEQVHLSLERVPDQGAKLVLRLHLKVNDSAEEKKVRDEITAEILCHAAQQGIDLSDWQKQAQAEEADPKAKPERPGYVVNGKVA